jgi:hypothetical protein
MRIFIFIIVIVLLVSCSQSETGWKQTASGLEFKIIHGKAKGSVAGSGATVKFHQYWYWHDTLKMNSRDSLPLYQALIPGLIFPYDPTEAFLHGVQEGDSVVVNLRIDSLYKQRRIDTLRGNMKLTDRWVIGMKVLKIFPFDPLHSDSIVMADRLKEYETYKKRKDLNVNKK